MPYQTLLYDSADAVATITLNRPDRLNTIVPPMPDELQAAVERALAEEHVTVIVLRGAGRSFCAGFDFSGGFHHWDEHLATGGAWDPGKDFMMATAQALGPVPKFMSLWRSPKPVIAQVHGACIAGGLMLAWICDLIVAADDAFFADPVVRMGIPGVEYFAHPWVMGPRQAKEFLFLGERISAARAYELGMVNRVVPRDQLAGEVSMLAAKIAAMPRLGLALTKKAVNQAEDAMGLQVGMDSVFGLHHLAHAHNAETGTDSLAGHDARSMRDRGAS